jgi:hypothetical protein
MRRARQRFHSSEQGVEIRKPMQRGSIIAGLESVLESVSKRENQ